jgi:hypothetical protein
MKLLRLTLVVAALTASCSDSNVFRASMKELMPQAVGSFRLLGEVRPVAIAASTKTGLNSRVPKEGLAAHYQREDKTQVNLQVINYASAADAQQALQQMENDFSQPQYGAKLSKANRRKRSRGKALRKLIVDDVPPGTHMILWVDRSLLYQVSGNNSTAVQIFEEDLP